MHQVSLFSWEGDGFVPLDNLGVPSRASYFADGFFDTQLWMHGKPVFWEQHFERMLATAAYLHLNGIDWNQFFQALSGFLQTGFTQAWLRVRLQFFRSGQGRYFPESNRASVWLEVQPLNADPWRSVPALQAKLSDGFWYAHPHDRYKLIARQEYVRFAIEAQDRGLFELIIRDKTDHLVSCVAGNLLVFLEGRWLTPHTAFGAMEGTTRASLLKAGLVAAADLPVHVLAGASALARCNAISGIVALNKKDEKAVETLRSALVALRGAP